MTCSFACKTVLFGIAVVASCAAFANRSKPIFRLAFDGTAEANCAGGDAKPVVANGLEFGPGRTGQAVRLSDAAKSRLAYSARGNIDPFRGSMSFWIKRDKSDARCHELLSLERGGESGMGRFRFAFTGPTQLVYDRDEIGGGNKTTGKELGTYKYEAGVWEHWIVTWGVRKGEMRVFRGGDGTREFCGKVSEEEKYRVLPRTIGAMMRFKDGAAEPERFFLGCGESEVSYSIDAWLDDVEIYDRPLSFAEVEAVFDSDRRAAIVSARHFGIAGDRTELRVEVDPRAADLNGAKVSLVSRKDSKVLASVPFDSTASGAALEATLPAGRYEYRLVAADGTLLARDDYTVLRAGNPYELPPTERPGEPRAVRFVKTVKPDLAELPPDHFKAIGCCAMRELGGMTYLEGGTHERDRFAIRFTLPTNVPLYQLEFVYPDDKFRTMSLTIQSTTKPSGDALSLGLSTGREFPCTMKMQSLKALYWSGVSEDVTLVSMAWMQNAPAAISEIRVWEVVDAALPVADVRPPPENSDAIGRQFGHFWEDPNLVGSIGIGVSTPESFSDLIDRYAASLRFCGQNIVSYPGSWYSGLITAADDARVGTHVDHFLEGWYAKFEKEGIFVMPSLESIHLRHPPDIELSPESVSNGTLHSSPWAIHSTGCTAARFNHSLPQIVNFFHPAAQRELEESIRALVREGAPYKAFKGISLQLYRDGFGWWGDICSGYNDYCIEAFERDTGIKVPVGRGDPLRGKAYHDWITANCRDAWVGWRCDKFVEFYSRMAKILSDARPDLRLWFIVAPAFDGVNDLDANLDYFEESHASRTLKDAGFDGTKVAAAIPNAIVSVTVHPQRHRKRWYWCKTSEALSRYMGYPASEGFYREMLKCGFPHVTLRDEFMELNVRKFPAGSPQTLTGGWLQEKGWLCGTINASGRNAMRYFAVPLRFGDILGFTRGGFGIYDNGYQQLEAQFAKAFRTLPDIRMSDYPFTSDKPDVVRVRFAEKNGRRWYYAVNTDSVPANVSFTVNGGVVDTLDDTVRSGRVNLSLKPYELRSFVTATSGESK